jgi:hypothetical protein
MAKEPTELRPKAVRPIRPGNVEKHELYAEVGRAIVLLRAAAGDGFVHLRKLKQRDGVERLGKVQDNTVPSRVGRCRRLGGE